MSPPVALASVFHAAAAAVGPLRAAVRARVALWSALARERRSLARLDARLLRDIGIDAGAAAREAERPFWDAPARRLRR
jgi:uncharacterized protein YjiS (DUF1127 family)